eukprot:1147745-Pelagomonas_calceolata.AAC.1
MSSREWEDSLPSRGSTAMAFKLRGSTMMASCTMMASGRLSCVLGGCPNGNFQWGDNTCLHWAAMRGHVEIVKVLLQTIQSQSNLLFRSSAILYSPFNLPPDLWWGPC